MSKEFKIVNGPEGSFPTNFTLKSTDETGTEQVEYSIGTVDLHMPTKTMTTISRGVCPLRLLSPSTTTYARRIDKEGPPRGMKLRRYGGARLPWTCLARSLWLSSES